MRMESMLKRYKADHFWYNVMYAHFNTDAESEYKKQNEIKHFN